MVDPAALAPDAPFVVFLAVFAGVLLGQVEVGDVSLGVTGELFAGLALGSVGFSVPAAGA